MISVRYDYLALTDLQRERLHAWVDSLGIDHTRVPVDSSIGYDPVTREYVLDVYKLDGGRKYLDHDGMPARCSLRRVPRELPPAPIGRQLRRELERVLVEAAGGRR